MSLFGSLFSGVSGLSAQSRAMGMISDNVANVNTTAYKGSTAQFSNLVTGQVRTRNYNTCGVRATTTQAVANQGLIQGTSSPTDAAISGAGFFVPNSRSEGNGEQVYTRAGAFAPDYLGNLRTPSGHYLQGWALDADGEVIDVNTLATVNTRSISGVAAATTSVEFGANLDADEELFAGAYAVGDLAAHAASGGAPGIQPHFKHAVKVYDSQGRPHDVTMAFLGAGAADSWRVEIYADPADVDTDTHADGLVASGTVTFDGEGQLAAVNLTPVSAGAAAGQVGIVWAPSLGVAPSSITFDFGTPGQTDGLSQFAAATDLTQANQNGALVGLLSGVSIDESGYVIAGFTNGEERRLYKLPLATFANPNALGARSGNIFAQTDTSGESSLRAAGVGSAGTITPSALEAANIDLADEFTRMIVTQRAYSANARVISTADEMLDELIRISR